MEDDDKFAERFRIDSTRLSGWNYGDDGYYFVTICAKDRECYFGDVLCDNNGEYSVALTDVGKIAAKYWLDIPKFHPYVVLDLFIIMPNHLHGIIIINKIVETPYLASHKIHRPSLSNIQNETRRIAGIDETPGMASLQEGDGEYKNQFGPQSQNLASILRGFKSGVTVYARKYNIDFSWQERYYDRIIRNEQALNKIRQYIITNPQKWEHDRNNPESIWM